MANKRNLGMPVWRNDMSYADFSRRVEEYRRPLNVRLRREAAARDRHDRLSTRLHRAATWVSAALLRWGWLG
jgi:hypothetical protein